jgi:anti-sigma B factor antagonist
MAVFRVGTEEGEKEAGPPPAEVAGRAGDRGTRVVERELRVTVEFGAESATAGPTITVAGEVDIQTSPILEERLVSVLDQGLSSVVVDLGQVTFLDSTGLSVLIAGLKRCQTVGGTLRVVSPQPNVRRVFAITGLADAFALASEDESTPD